MGEDRRDRRDERPSPRCAVSANECVGYRTIAREKDGNYWRTVIDEEAVTDFCVRDDTGTALVRVDNRERLTLDRETKFASGFGSETTRQIIAFLQKHGQSPRGAVLARKLVFRESVLEEGNTVAVVGVVSHALHEAPPADGAAFREPSRQIVLAGTAERPLEITDAPATG